MELFKAGDRVVQKSTFSKKTTYTLRAVGEPGITGYPAWAISDLNKDFGEIIDLEYMERYFEPGFFRLKNHPHADVTWNTSHPGTPFERVNVTVVEENND